MFMLCLNVAQRRWKYLLNCITFRKDHKKCEFELHEVYGVDILISTGEGKAKEKENRTTVYKRTDIHYGLKMKASRSKLI